MTAQETENQTGGAEPQDTIASVHAEDATGVDENGNEVEIKAGDPAIISASDIVEGNESAPTGAEPTAEAGESAPAADAVPASAPQVSTAEPAPDAPKTPRDKLHDDAVAFIIAARMLGIDAAEFVKAKMEEIAD